MCILYGLCTLNPNCIIPYPVCMIYTILYYTCSLELYIYYHTLFTHYIYTLYYIHNSISRLQQYTIYHILPPRTYTNYEKHCR